jgi:hypothetical protein
MVMVEGVTGAIRTALVPGSTEATTPWSTSQVTTALDGRGPLSFRGNSSPTRISQSSGRMVKMSFWVVTGLEAGAIESRRKSTALRAKMRNINGILESCDNFVGQDGLPADRVHCVCRETLQKRKLVVCRLERSMKEHQPHFPCFTRAGAIWNHFYRRMERANEFEGFSTVA